MKKITCAKRDSKFVERLYNEERTMKAVCQISVIDKKYRYTNVALQKIVFIVNNVEYYFDHVWLQGRDYKACSELANKKPGEWIEITFNFYQYRDKIDKNEAGRMMHGLNVKSFKELSKPLVKTYEDKFIGIVNKKFKKFNK